MYQEETTSIKENLISEKISIYPNPVNDLLKIESGTVITEWVEVTNLIGKVVLKKQIDRMNDELNLGQLSSGVYFLTGKTEDGYWTRKIIKN